MIGSPPIVGCAVAAFELSIAVTRPKRAPELADVPALAQFGLVPIGDSPAAPGECHRVRLVNPVCSSSLNIDGMDRIRIENL